MKENKLPFTLAFILFNVVDFEFRPTRSALSELVFDQRHDLVLSRPSPRLAIRMVFANELCLSGKTGKGVRRPVDVALIDATTRNLHVSTTVNVHLKDGCAYGNTHLCLPLDFDRVDFSHPYIVSVRDKKSGHVLGGQEIHFFRQFYGDSFISEILTPVYAGIEPNFSDALYKSFDADLMTYHHVRFHLVPGNCATLPTFMPEMELRTYFPDGSIQSDFVTPVKDKDDEYPEIYRVSAPIFVTPPKKGVCYSELICDDIPIAGIVFGTEGVSSYGPWRAPDLDPMEEYWLGDAAKRLKTTLDVYENKTIGLLTYEDIEKSLENLMSSQQGQECDEGTASAGESTDEDLHPIAGETVSSLNALDDLTGLRSVKEKLQAYENLVLFNKKRQERELPTMRLPLHAMFWGSPGTGKTTVAKRMGMMLHQAGVLSKGHVVVKERSNLIGPFYSNEETNTLEAIEEAQGGILFIDEAYQLYQPDDPRDPGKFVIEALMTALADESKRDWMLILAGYTDEMKRMFEMNPGLKSRIPESNIYVFDDFSEDELMEIAERYLERNSYSMTEDARMALSSRLGDDYRNRSRSFGNARYVINLIQTEILPSMASRVASIDHPDTESLSLIRQCDIPKNKKLVQDNRPKIGYCA